MQNKVPMHRNALRYFLLKTFHQKYPDEEIGSKCGDGQMHQTGNDILVQILRKYFQSRATICRACQSCRKHPKQMVSK